MSLDEAPADFRLLTLHTDELQPRERLDFWRDVLSRKLLRVAIDPVSERPFRAEASLRAQHGVRMGLGSLGPTISHRTRDIVADDNDDVALLVNLEGPFIARQGADELDLDAGEGVVADCRAVGAFVRPTPGRLLCIRMPRAVLGEYSCGVDAALGRRIAPDTDTLRLLVSYVTALNQPPGLMLPPEASYPIVRHVCDLAALTIGAGRDGAHLAENRGLAAARLQAIKAQVNANIGARALTVDEAAASQGVTARYVRKLFEAEGLSFTNYVTERRLARAHALLTEPLRTPAPISAIAYDVGFGDLSYFNRAFRRRYGATPSEVREEAMRRRQS
ncbi:MAG TPA: AraC family transcriptional regulator [Caulobacteraceae bacterium]